MILIDECGQTTEPETVIAISKGSSHLKLVLVGDHNQLAPFIPVNTEVAKELETSLFEKLIEIKKIKPFTLNVQFRMHSSISAFTYNHFYNTGTNPVNVQNAPTLDAEFEKYFNELKAMCTIVNKKALWVKNVPDTVEVISWRYNFRSDQVEKWLSETDWNYKGIESPLAFEQTIQYLLNFLALIFIREL